uniref:PPPDE domain-containing protein n=1 Tax=Haptolina ericina TaxID=156174 RepID=A0A7S3ERC3_9EUKA|mmetsp:Transcript_1590/g.3455  ORF Transcript_1590/g.3455 Transcript_1590/m.3455 type:complete len:487 (+) Transcript_1590:79-1539(+)
MTSSPDLSGALLEASTRGDTLRVRDLLRRGGSIGLVGATGGTTTALHAAATAGNVGAVTMLLAQGASTNLADAQGQTPLHSAAIAGHVKVVRMLCRAKAVLDVRDNEGRVPWEAAVYSGHTAVVDALMGASKEAGQVAARRGQVLLHIYDLGKEVGVRRLNAVASVLGGGLYHTAVEVEGMTEGLEWSFGYAKDESGVFSWAAKENPAHSFRETVALGATKLSIAELEEILERMREEWDGNSYHLVVHNCQSFCETLCGELGVGPLPDWVRRFAKIGGQFVRLTAQKGPPQCRLDRSQAVQEGIAMLKTGVRALKYSRHGRPRLAMFKLSEDERILSWEGRLLTKSIEIADVLELLVGQTSAVFRRNAAEEACRSSAQEHLSLTLVLMASLPTPPSEAHDEHGRRLAVEMEPSGSGERQSLDIVCSEEEEFGLWVAALRALLDELQAAAVSTVAATAALSPSHPTLRLNQFARSDAQSCLGATSDA